MYKFRYLLSPTLTLIIIICLSFNSCGSKDKVQKQLEKLAENLNKELPIQHDALVRCDKCEALPNHILKYYYTFLFSTNDNDTVAFKEKTKPSLLYNIQTNPSMNYLRDNGITFIYSYKDEQGKPQGDIVITPDDYNKPAIKPDQTLTDSNINWNDIESALNTIAENMKKQLPIHLKEFDMSIVDCAVHPDSTLAYTYKLYNESVSAFDSTQFIKDTYPSMIENLKIDPSANMMAHKGVSLRYIYNDKDNKYLCSIIISPQEYRNTLSDPK